MQSCGMNAPPETVMETPCTRLDACIIQALALVTIPSKRWSIIVRQPKTTNQQPSIRLAECTKPGGGVQVDMIQAYFWYSLSERHRAQALKFDPKNDPREALQRIDKLLNNSQRDFGEKLLKNWPASP